MINTINNEQEYLVQKIRTQYTEKQHTELDELRELNRKVRTPANVFAYVFGSLSALVMGCGMSLIMTDIGQTIGVASPMTPGIVIGLVGLAMAIANYPVYSGMLARRRKRYAQQIIRLSDRITKGVQA